MFIVSMWNCLFLVLLLEISELFGLDLQLVFDLIVFLYNVI